MEGKFELEEPTLAAAYRRLCSDFNEIIESPDETNSSSSQERIAKSIRGLEEITLLVSAVDMFSVNESFEEIPPENLKFALLPYMLGALWQVNTREDRKTVCQLSVTYFQDFLQRSFDYGIIFKLPSPENAESTSQSAPKSAQETRNEKIQRIKETKELESKIEAITQREKDGEELDEEVTRELYIAKIRRAANKTESELAMIAQEIQLIKFAEGRKSNPGDPAAGEPNNLRPQRKAPSTFIITRNEEQKKVYGLGYPAVPVLTVEEFYQQRRDAGIWPGGSHSRTPVTINNVEENDDSAKNEALEELDDPDILRRQRDMDEYKDMHRRGWGNRANRS